MAGLHLVPQLQKHSTTIENHLLVSQIVKEDYGPIRFITSRIDNDVYDIKLIGLELLWLLLRLEKFIALQRMLVFECFYVKKKFKKWCMVFTVINKKKKIRVKVAPKYEKWGNDVFSGSFISELMFIDNTSYILFCLSSKL